MSIPDVITENFENRNNIQTILPSKIGHFLSTHELADNRFVNSIN